MRRTLALSAGFLGALFLSTVVCAAAPTDPAKLVTLADVEKALGAKFKLEVPEPGMVQFLEQGGLGRVVDVFLTDSPRPKLGDLKAQLVQDQEPVEDVAGVGDGAFYRSQRQEAMVEKVSDAGAVQLAIAIHNDADGAKAKEHALALLRIGAGRL